MEYFLSRTGSYVYQVHAVGDSIYQLQLLIDVTIVRGEGVSVNQLTKHVCDLDGYFCIFFCSQCAFDVKGAFVRVREEDEVVYSCCY